MPKTNPMSILNMARLSIILAVAHVESHVHPEYEFGSSGLPEGSHDSWLAVGEPPHYPC